MIAQEDVLCKISKSAANLQNLQYKIYPETNFGVGIRRQHSH